MVVMRSYQTKRHRPREIDRPHHRRQLEPESHRVASTTYDEERRTLPRNLDPYIHRMMYGGSPCSCGEQGEPVSISTTICHQLDEHHRSARTGYQFSSPEHGLDLPTGAGVWRAAVRQSSRTARCNWRWRAGSVITVIAVIFPPLIRRSTTASSRPRGATTIPTEPSTSTARQAWKT